MENSCSERRAALIAVLIAVPSSVLIGMLIHYFVPIPSEPISEFFNFSGKPAGNVPGTPAAAAPQMQRRAPRQGVRPEAGKELSELYQKRVKLAKERLAFAENEFKNGTGPQEKIRELAMLCRFAEGDLFRHENGIRRWGNSVSDLAVKYDLAKAEAEKAEKLFKSGNGSRDLYLEKEMAKLDLELQLKSHRFFSNEGWQAAYREYLKVPDEKTYQGMLAAEQAAQPARPF